MPEEEPEIQPRGRVRNPGRLLSRFLLVESAVAMLMGLYTAFQATQGGSVIAPLASGSLLLLCSMILSWGAGLYFFSAEHAVYPLTHTRRDSASRYIPYRFGRPAPWRGDDILFGLTGSWVALNTIAFLVQLAADTLLRVADPYSTSDPHAVIATAIADTVGYMAMVGNILIFVLWRRGGQPADIGWRKPVTSDWFFAVPLIAAGTIAVADLVLVRLNRLVIPTAVSSQCTDIRGDFGKFLIVALLVTTIVAPIFEETVFRGFLFGWLRGHIGWIPAAIVSGLVFSAFHVELALILPLWLLGIVLALVYEKSKSLFPGMLIHGLFNITGTVLIILNSRGCH